MTVDQFLQTIKDLDDYVSNSLYLKSSDIYGCTYKWLVYRNNKSYAVRQEVFIELNPEEVSGDILDKTYVNSVIVEPAE